MSQYAVMPLTDYKDACNEIREKTGGVDDIVSGELKTEITKVYEAGEKAENGRMWDYIQNYGNRTFYQYTFSGWNCEYIRPKYKVVFTGSSDRSTAFNNNTNLRLVEKAYFDFSNCPRGTNNASSWHYTFSQDGNLEVIEDIGLNNAFSFNSTFLYCGKLHTIECIYPDKDTKFNNAFNYCNSLVHIRIGDGCVIGQDINFQWSPLNLESAKSVINALYNYMDEGQQTYSFTVYFSEETWALLDAEGDTSPAGIGWKEYVNILGWNAG